MGFKNIKDVFEAFQNLKVLVIGDVMVDAYIYGSVKRISPEAPVPVVNVKKRENRLGGAANVALNIASLGAEPILCSLIGNDPEAEVFSALLKESKLPTEGIIKSDHRITTVKNRILAGSQQMLRIDSETDVKQSDLECKSLLSHIKKLARLCHLIIFEDYDKGCIDENIIEGTISFAKEHNIPTAVDPKKRNFLSYKDCTLFKPNLKELAEGIKLDIDPARHETVKQALIALQNIMPHENSLVTLSEHGIQFQNSKDSFNLPAHIRNVSDVSGAGDTVVSIAGLCLALGLPPRFFSALSNLGGGIVCEDLGVVPIDKHKLIKEAIENDVESYL